MTTARTLLLVGGGGHAAVVAESARGAGWTIAGYLDDRTDERDARLVGLRRLGAIEDLPRLLEAIAAKGPEPAAHAAVGDASLRRRWTDAIATALAPPIVHPSAVVSPTARLADGVFVGPRAVVNARAVVERGAIVNSGAIVEHDCRLGEFCHVGPGAALAGGVTVGEAALVGLNASVLPGRRIGGRATLGAGAVALEDVPDDATAAGNPARVLAPQAAT